MNPVHKSFLGRARGVIHFSALDAWLLGTITVLGLLLCKVSVILGAVVAAVLASLVVLHRKLDHGREDHLEIRLRGWLRPPRWNLNEKDRKWKDFPHGK